MGPRDESGGGIGTGAPVADSSSLIALHQLGLLTLLGDLYATIVIPPTVQLEVKSVGELPDWISVIPFLSEKLEENIGRQLHPGEIEALRLAIQSKSPLLITDDLAARKAAQRLSIRVVGVLGVLVLAKHEGLIKEVRPYIESLLRVGFRLGQTVCAEALRSAGEDPSELLETITDEPQSCD